MPVARNCGRVGVGQCGVWALRLDDFLEGSKLEGGENKKRTNCGNRVLLNPDTREVEQIHDFLFRKIFAEVCLRTMYLDSRVSV